MQEKQVTIGDHTYALSNPFMVMATQNPIEQEGTYPLPEAQVDRFMMEVKVGYPSREEELEILNRMTTENIPKVEKVVSPQDILKARKLVEQVYIDDKLKEYIVALVFASREPEKAGLNDLKGMIAYGASPRATIALSMVARAHAFLRHRGYVTPEDIKQTGFDVLRHRIIVSYEGEAEELTPEIIIQRIFDSVEIP
jgi:MoxR-like ATPase